ncbi:plasmid replication protein, CyRepA1 family [Baaleninema simplex]|uniref:plasmid replication protein, CyRepA1 family n=1 Tax=Baaleninema simplex TaxID=2862350 RepID=UPI00037D6889|nr:plasmid replication protein, CyRepA1 family [Baaleninema simplex]
MSYTKQLTTNCQSSPTPDRCVSPHTSTTEEETQRFTTPSQKSFQTQPEHPPSSESTQNRGENRTNRPPWIDTAHWRELTEGSAIDPAIARSNWRSVGGSKAWELVMAATATQPGGKHRRNDGRLRDWILKKYAHLDDGGLWCNGLDPLDDWQPMEWGQLKPRSPRQSLDNGKVKNIKYETLLATETRLFCLRVPLHIWYLVAQRNGVEMPTGITVTPDGEAIGFWKWVVENPEISIVVTEGAKKAGALLSKGLAAIALPGVWNGQVKSKDLLERRKLKADLQPFAVPGRRIEFAFDSDAKNSTRKNVAKAVLATGRIFKMEGCTVAIWQWASEKGKGIDDFIANGGNVDEVADRAVELDRFGAIDLFRLTYPASIVVDPNQKYIGDLEIPDNAKLVGIKAPKGSGKTESLSRVVYEAQQRGIPCLVITHRIQLAKVLARRFGIPYVSEVKDSPEGKALGYALCFDSLHADGAAAFDPAGWHDAYVAIDEAEQALWHLLEANTDIDKRRTRVLDNLRELLYNVLTSDEGKVFLADADLSDRAIDFVLKSTGLYREIRPFIVRHDRPGSSYHVTVYEDGDPAGWWGACINAIARGQRVLVHLTGQKPKSRWSATNLERLVRKAFPELRVLRVDSHTVADPSHPAFNCVANVNGTFARYDVVIATPTIETGVSIDLEGHFQSVWVAASGITTADAVRQTMMRLREPVPRHLWCPTYAATGKIGNGSMSPYHVLKHEKGRVRITLQSLKDADLNAAIEQDIECETLSAAQWTWAEMAARANVGFVHYRDSIVDGLREEGCTAKFVESDRDDAGDIRDEVKQGSEETWGEHREGVASAPKLDDTQYQKISEKQDKTEDEHRQCERYDISQRYGIDDVTPELVKAHEDGTGAKWRNHYYLFRGRRYLKHRDSRKLRSLRERGAVFVRDASKRVKSPHIEALDRVGITQLLQYAIDNPDEVWHNSHSMLVKLRQRCERTKNLEIAISPPRQKETNILFFKRICERFAFNLARTGRQGGGDREWLYRFSIPDDGREAIFDFWLERDEESLRKEPELSVQNHTSDAETSTHVRQATPTSKTLTANGLNSYQKASTHGYINKGSTCGRSNLQSPTSQTTPQEPSQSPPSWTETIGQIGEVPNAGASHTTRASGFTGQHRHQANWVLVLPRLWKSGLPQAIALTPVTHRVTPAATRLLQVDLCRLSPFGLMDTVNAEGNSFPDLPIYLRQESKLYFEVSLSVRYGRARPTESCCENLVLRASSSSPCTQRLESILGDRFKRGYGVQIP